MTKHRHVPKPDIYRYRYINIIDIDDVLLNWNGTIVVCVIVIARIKYIIDDCVHQAWARPAFIIDGFTHLPNPIIAD